MKISLSNLLATLREYSQKPPIKEMSSQDRIKWARLCTCMDTLSDTQCAINAFRETAKDADKAELYLRTYGVLQAMFVQQDALQSLANVLGIRMAIKKDNPSIKEIRGIRNELVGHPTDQRNGQTHNRIVQRTLSSRGFASIKFSAKNDSKREWINMVDLTATNERHLAGYMQQILDNINQQRIELSDSFRYKELEPIIPNQLVKCLDSLLFGVCQLSMNQQQIIQVLDVINEAIPQLSFALKERQYSRDHGIFRHVDRVAFAVLSIRRCVGIESETSMDLSRDFDMCIEAYCFALRSIFSDIMDSSNANVDSLRCIESNWRYYIEKVESIADNGCDSLQYIVINLNSLWDTIPKLLITLSWGESDSQVYDFFRRKVEQMEQIIQILERQINLDKILTDDVFENTTLNISVYFIYLKNHLVNIQEISLDIDDEYRNIAPQ